MTGDDGKRHWLDDKRLPKRLYWGLIVLCAGLGAADLVYHRHGHFSFEEVPLAYGAFGFVCFFAIVLCGYPLRRLVGRDEDYYDR